MNYKFTLLVEDENDNIVIRIEHSGSAGYCREMLEMNLDKMEKAMIANKAKAEAEMHTEIEREQEDKEYFGDDSICGKPENHNNGETDGCLECGVLKANV